MAFSTRSDWITGSYTTDVQYLIEVAENAPLANDPNATNIGVELDSKGRPFIGYGFDLLSYKSDPDQAVAALTAAGAVIVDADQLTNLIQNEIAPLNEGELDLIAGAVYLPNQASAVALLKASIATAESGLTAFLTKTLNIGDIPDSNEREALVDLYYNGGGGPGGYFLKADGTLTNMSQALISGNRAEVWFEIRYRSAANGGGLIARRYVDSQLFGLYADPLQATATEALQAYQMLTANRPAIIAYELKNGSNPYGSGALTPAGYIAAANQTYNLAGTGAEVQTLAEIFEPAAQEEVQYLSGLYSGVLPCIQIDDTGDTTSSAFDVRSIDFYAASPTDQTVDADNAPGATAADVLANHILLGSESGDQLIGGEGNDILVAQSGDETLQAGAGSDTLISDSGNDTVRLGGSSDVLDFVFPGASGYTETVIENNGATVGSIDINGSQIGSDLTATGLDTWTDQNGNTYQFVADPSSTPAGYFPGTSGPDVGELKIILGGLSGGNEIDIWGFDLSQAENSSLGFLGITLPPTVSLNAGSTDGVDPPAPNFTAGTAQSYTVSVDAPTMSAETVTVTLTGAPASDFGLVSGISIIPLNADGTFTVTIPAGQTSASFSLANTGDVGSTASLQLVASISDPTNQNDIISSTPLTQSYVEPTEDPFGKPSAAVLYDGGATGDTTTTGGLVYSAYFNSIGAPPAGESPVSAVSSGNNFINVVDDQNTSIEGGTGNDTIYADFGQTNGSAGVDVINGDGGQDDILVRDVQTPYQWGADFGGVTAPDGATTARIYANSETALATAIADANTDSSTGKQGDLILSSAPGTVVGGDGNDLIMTDSGGMVVAGSGDDTIATGAPIVFTTADWSGLSSRYAGVTWNASMSGDQLVVGGGSVYLGRQSDTAPASNYEGNLDDTGGAFDATNDTIFGGEGQDVILLSNGNDDVNLGIGDSTVLGGMGSDTISGGAGNNSIVGGGGSDYIAAGSGNDLIAGRGGNNTIFGGSGTDTIFAGGQDSNWTTEETGSNYVQAGSGNTLIYGSGGNDTLIGGSGADTLQAGSGNESIVGGSGDTSVNGGSGVDTIVAGNGSDTIWGSTKSTTIYGGTGTDWISGRGGTDIIYAGDGGTSQAATTITAGSGDTTIYGGGGVDQISGGSGNDVIYAGDGGTAGAATQIVAGSGSTTVYGGDGVDHIFGGSGTDVLYSGDGGTGGSPSYVMAGTGMATLYGGAGAAVLNDSQGGSDVLEAGSGETTLVGVGHDTLIAGSGSDYLAGGPASTYVFGSNTGVDEVAGTGSATLEFASSVSSSDVSLAAVLDSAGEGSLTMDEGDGSITVDGALSGANEIGSVVFDDPESLSLAQFIQQEASLGNAAATTVAGANGNFIFDAGNGDVVSGGSGQDTMSAWGNNDTLTAGSGGTAIFAEGTNDSVTGGSGNDTLDAAAAGTTLVGGTGNEVFQVNDTTEVVQAQAGAASNELYSSVSYTLPTNVDVMTLTGTANLSATGNDDAGNIITGNSGNDTLTAGSGGDTLVSGNGVDTLVGGSGPDTFVINNSADVVEPGWSGWQDTIDASVSYILTAQVGELDLTGSGNLTATDNYGYATITANAGNDTLIGGSGSDVLISGTGVDTFVAGSGSNIFVIDNVADVIQLGSTLGSDTVESSVSYTLAQRLDTLQLTGKRQSRGAGQCRYGQFARGEFGQRHANCRIRERYAGRRVSR